MQRTGSKHGAAGWFLFQVVAYTIVALPSIVVIGASFNAGAQLRFPPAALSLNWYWKALSTGAFAKSFLLSANLALVSTFLALAIGTPAAYALARFRVPGAALAQSFLHSPLLMPSSILGIGLLQLTVAAGLSQGFWVLVMGHFIITLPYAVRTLTANFLLFDPALERAAQSLRASPAITWLRVTIPVLTPGFITAGIFCFIMSFGNITLSMFLSGGGQVTLPVQMFIYVENSNDPTLAALSSLIILLTLSAIILIARCTDLKRLV
jgi:putative spermidine/putrescine transport system permease protein